MRRSITLLMLGGLLVGVLLPGLATAQDETNAWTLYDLNMRAGPGLDYGVVAVLAPNTGLVIAAHDGALEWLLAHTTDGTQRGWVHSLYLRYQDGFSAARLPASSEVLQTAPETAPAASGPGPEEQSGSGELSGSSAEMAAFLESVPVIPAISDHARAVYQSGNHRHRFSKVGDCNTYEWSFLSPFDTGQYDLGDYGDLQPTISYYAGSFGRNSLAAHVGFNALTVIDAAWANPATCQPGEAPVWCEYRTWQPAAAIIMFGANDVYLLSPDQYEASLRQTITWTLQHG
ncbi:MAG: SH3 domain-containing protein, partial [Chloroflexi bacterium]|nr:SH3 domain-containing protein [Chloroflexota bacterium]